MALTEKGQELHRVATDVLERLQDATDEIKQRSRTRQISITTTTGFASLWLIPRLQRFTNAHPDIDVRISATIDVLNLERSAIDLAIRYCRPETVPEDAVRLFGEEVLPVCSPALLRRGARPLKRPQDLVHQVLLHFDYPLAEKMVMDWQTWLTALGIGDLKAAGGLYFTQYEQMIQAAISGQGVALGRQPLVNELLQSGGLVAPFDKAIVGTRAYFVLESKLAARKPYIKEFSAWLTEEVKRELAPRSS